MPPDRRAVHGGHSFFLLSNHRDMGYKFSDFGTRHTVSGMPKRLPKQELEERFDDTEHGEVPSGASDKVNSESPGSENIPRWRKIEIMKERAALREALGEDELDLEALEMEVFGSEEENQSLYRHDGSEADEEEIEFEDDGFEDDDFEEFDDD